MSPRSFPLATLVAVSPLPVCVYVAGSFATGAHPRPAVAAGLIAPAVVLAALLRRRVVRQRRDHLDGQYLDELRHLQQRRAERLAAQEPTVALPVVVRPPQAPAPARDGRRHEGSHRRLLGVPSADGVPSEERVLGFFQGLFAARREQADLDNAQDPSDPTDNPGQE